MIKFIRDDGLTLNITDYFKIISIEGLGTITQEIFTEKRAVGDGDIITGTRVSSRTVTITACNDYAGQFDTSREKINSFFNPKNTFKMYVTYKNNTVWCECIVDARDLPTNNIFAPQMFTLSVFCPSPYFKSYDDFGEDLSTIVPMMGFPLVISAEKGFVASARNFAQHVFVPNDGAVETYCTIVIEPEENVNGLKIYKNDEEFVLFSIELKAYETVKIDFERRTVEIDGKKVPNCLNRRSTFFAIERGGCNISYSADSNETSTHIYLYYNQLYAGV